MFCSCSADYASASPNTHVCPICLGMPGVLPVINQRAVEYTVMTALALKCDICEYAKFDRKNYPYPDLMKGYQISQYDAPIGQHGWLELELEGMRKKVGITRVHLEEDVAKLTHITSSEGESFSLMDVNRAGVPLMEIVGEPDISNPDEARQYLIQLRDILRYLGVSTGNMEEGSFRCDANISIRPEGSSKYYSKVEIKNMNSFRAVHRALSYEAKRQEETMARGEKIHQETRGWVDEKGITVSQRSKEYAHDYRYFPEPDLPPLLFQKSHVDALRGNLHELPDSKRKRFMEKYLLSKYDTDLLLDSRELADYFEQCINIIKCRSTYPEIGSKAKSISNWLLGDFSRMVNQAHIKIGEIKAKPEYVVDLVDLIDDGTISGPVAKAVFEEMFLTGKKAKEIVAQKNLVQISNTDEIEKIIEQTILANRSAVADYEAGKQPALTFLVGQVMKASKGRANPGLVNQILLEKLGGDKNA